MNRSARAALALLLLLYGAPSCESPGDSNAPSDGSAGEAAPGDGCAAGTSICPGTGDAGDAAAMTADGASADSGVPVHLRDAGDGSVLLHCPPMERVCSCAGGHYCAPPTAMCLLPKEPCPDTDGGQDGG